MDLDRLTELAKKKVELYDSSRPAGDLRLEVQWAAVLSQCYVAVELRKQRKNDQGK